MDEHEKKNILISKLPNFPIAFEIYKMNIIYVGTQIRESHTTQRDFLF
jgi:hypothetical protein